MRRNNTVSGRKDATNRRRYCSGRPSEAKLQNKEPITRPTCHREQQKLRAEGRQSGVERAACPHARDAFITLPHTPHLCCNLRLSESLRPPSSRSPAIVEENIINVRAGGRQRGARLGAARGSRPEKSGKSTNVHRSIAVRKSIKRQRRRQAGAANERFGARPAQHSALPKLPGCGAAGTQRAGAVSRPERRRNHAPHYERIIILGELAQSPSPVY